MEQMSPPEEGARLVHLALDWSGCGALSVARAHALAFLAHTRLDEVCKALPDEAPDFLGPQPLTEAEIFVARCSTLSDLVQHVLNDLHAHLSTPPDAWAGHDEARREHAERAKPFGAAVWLAWYAGFIAPKAGDVPHAGDLLKRHGDELRITHPRARPRGRPGVDRSLEVRRAFAAVERNPTLGLRGAATEILGGALPGTSAYRQVTALVEQMKAAGPEHPAVLLHGLVSEKRGRPKLGI